MLSLKETLSRVFGRSADSVRSRREAARVRSPREPRRLRVECLEERWVPCNPGTLDATFGTSGLVKTNFGGYDTANAVAVQSDGKSLVGGSVGVSASSNGDFALARYNANGTLDSSFGTGGKVTTDFPFKGVNSSDDEIRAIAIQSDGRIVVAGVAHSDFALARYNTNGTLDTTFGKKGELTTSIDTAGDIVYSLIIQPDGKLVAGGTSQDPTTGFERFALARYSSTGALDSTFGSSGKVITNVGPSGDRSFARGIALQSDGKIIAAGAVLLNPHSDDYRFAVVRYNTTGSLDGTFGVGGQVITQIGSGFGSEGANSVAIQGNGMIVAAGSTTINGVTEFALARYNPAGGTLDGTFGVGGIVTTSIGSGSDSEARGVAIQSDGKIVAAGFAWNGTFGTVGKKYDFALARYNSDGTLDTTFDTDGIVTTAVGSSVDMANAVAIQSDGNILVAGITHNTGTTNYADFAVARYCA